MLLQKQLLVNYGIYSYSSSWCMINYHPSPSRTLVNELCLIDVSQRGNKQMPEALEGTVCSWCDPQACLRKGDRTLKHNEHLR